MENPGKQTERPKRTRKRVNGRLMIVKEPTSRTNGKPRKTFISGHGGNSKALLRDPLDLRSSVGRAYYAEKQALRVHVGGDPTMPQEKLIDQCARLGVLNNIAWGELMRAGMLVQGDKLVPAFEAYIKAARELRDVLRLLGIERRTKPVPSLSEYLEGRNTEAAGAA
jgi:hypothetical protein